MGADLKPLVLSLALLLSVVAGPAALCQPPPPQHCIQLPVTEYSANPGETLVVNAELAVYLTGRATVRVFSDYLIVGGIAASVQLPRVLALPGEGKAVTYPMPIIFTIPENAPNGTYGVEVVGLDRNDEMIWLTNLFIDVGEPGELGPPRENYIHPPDSWIEKEDHPREIWLPIKPFHVTFTFRDKYGDGRTLNVSIGISDPGSDEIRWGFQDHPVQAGSSFTTSLLSGWWANAGVGGTYKLVVDVIYERWVLDVLVKCPGEGDPLDECVREALLLGAVEAELKTLYELEMRGCVAAENLLLLRFTDYSGNVEEERLIWQGEGVDNVLVSDNFGRSAPIKRALLVDAAGDVLFSFVVTRGRLIRRLSGITSCWPIVTSEERTTYMRELMHVKGAWAYAPA